MQKLMNLRIPATSSDVERFGVCYRHAKSIAGYVDLFSIRGYLATHFPNTDFLTVLSDILKCFEHFGDPYNQDLNFLKCEILEIVESI